MQSQITNLLLSHDSYNIEMAMGLMEELGITEEDLFQKDFPIPNLKSLKDLEDYRECLPSFNELYSCNTFANLDDIFIPHGVSYSKFWLFLLSDLGIKSNGVEIVRRARAKLNYNHSWDNYNELGIKFSNVTDEKFINDCISKVAKCKFITHVAVYNVKQNLSVILNPNIEAIDIYECEGTINFSGVQTIAHIYTLDSYVMLKGDDITVDSIAMNRMRIEKNIMSRDGRKPSKGMLNAKFANILHFQFFDFFGSVALGLGSLNAPRYCWRNYIINKSELKVCPSVIEVFVYKHNLISDWDIILTPLANLGKNSKTINFHLTLAELGYEYEDNCIIRRISLPIKQQ